MSVATAASVIQVMRRMGARPGAEKLWEPILCGRPQSSAMPRSVEVEVN